MHALQALDKADYRARNREQHYALSKFKTLEKERRLTTRNYPYKRMLDAIIHAIIQPGSKTSSPFVCAPLELPRSAARRCHGGAQDTWMLIAQPIARIEHLDASQLVVRHMMRQAEARHTASQ